ncbi:MAG: hypothetical protein IJV24_05840 [Prevotella sp.]|nr:hypothetical protein [Prevotella sp.]
MRTKKLFVVAALLTGSCGLSAMAGEKGDTLVFEKVDRVRIETRDTVQRITISGGKDSPEMYYAQRITIPDTTVVRRQMTNIRDFNKVNLPQRDGKPSQWGGSFHANFGLATLPGIDDSEVMRGVGAEIGFAITADWNPFGRKNTWRAGLGLNYRSYAAPKNKYWSKEGGAMHLVSFADEQENCSANLGIYSLQLPVVYTHKFDSRGRWSVSLGALVNWNFGQTHRSYEVNYEDYKVHAAARGLRPFTVDALAIVDVPYLPPLYVRYAPMTVFKDGCGPKMRQLSFGICF